MELVWKSDIWFGDKALDLKATVADVPFTSSGRRTEFIWKCDIWLGDKALGRNETVADVIHYCQLRKFINAVGEDVWTSHRTASASRCFLDRRRPASRRARFA